MTTKSEELKSILPSIEEVLDTRCPHCAVSKFLAIWQNRHADDNTSAQDIIGSLCEVLADVLKCYPKREVWPLALQAFLELGQNITDIIDGTYKSDKDAVVVKGHGEGSGGLH